MTPKGDQPKRPRADLFERLSRERDGILEYMCELDEALEKWPENKWFVNMRKHYERRVKELNQMLEDERQRREGSKN